MHYYDLWNTYDSHIFGIPSISNEKPGISIEIPSSISIENLGFRLEHYVFRIKNFEILGFSHLEFDILQESKYRNYKNHQAQNCQKIKNIIRIMTRLKYMINNLESPILILHQESALFTMECLLITMEVLQFRKTCVRNQHTNQSKHS